MNADRVEIGNAIIAGMAEGGTCLEQMASIVERLKLAGYVIVPKTPTSDMLEHAKQYMDSWSSNMAWWDAMIEAANR